MVLANPTKQNIIMQYSLSVILASRRLFANKQDQPAPTFLAAM